MSWELPLSDETLEGIGFAVVSKTAVDERNRFGKEFGKPPRYGSGRNWAHCETNWMRLDVVSDCH